MKLGLLAVLACAATAGAAPRDLQLGVGLGVPGEGSGAPVGGLHVPVGVRARYALRAWHALRVWRAAIEGGVGVPIASVGASVWAGLEVRRRLAPRVMIYATPGLRTGFVGPGYDARHSDVFVGDAYSYSGPWTIAPRLAAGIAVPVGRAEVWVEALVEAPLLPGPELLVGGSLGVRVRL